MNFDLNRHRGFTLIELMIVVAVIGLLAAIAYPSYTSQIAKGRRAECRSGLLQSMQQQERYYSQYTAYAPFSEGLATARTKAYSGDSPAASSCLLQGIDCTTAGSTPTNQCIELRARPLQLDSSINYLYLTSDGERGCSVSSVRTTANIICWP